VPCVTSTLAYESNYYCRESKAKEKKPVAFTCRAVRRCIAAAVVGAISQMVDKPKVIKKETLPLAVAQSIELPAAENPLGNQKVAQRCKRIAVFCRGCNNVPKIVQ
jgi:hypothetical protein